MNLQEIVSKFLLENPMVGTTQEKHNFMVDFMKLCFRHGITDFKDETEIESTYGYVNKFMCFDEEKRSKM